MRRLRSTAILAILMAMVVLLGACGSKPSNEALDAGVLRVTASQAAADEDLLPHAAAIQEHLTAMFGILWQRRMDAAAEPAPELPVVPE